MSTFIASEAPWLKGLPTGWEPKSLRFILQNNDGGAWGGDPNGEDDVVVLRSTEQTSGGYWNIEEPAYRSLSASEHQATCLLKGDLLVTKSSGSAIHIGKTTLVDDDVAALRAGYSNFMQRLRVEDGVEPKFVWYLLNSDQAKLQINLESTTTTGLANLNGGLLGRLIFAFPDQSAQITIAAYLDAETKRIDELIDEKQSLLKSLAELRVTRITEILTGAGLEQKDTGSEWLPKIPKGWELKRLKFMGQVRSGVAKGKKYDGQTTVEMPYLRVANVQDGYLKLDEISMIEVSTEEVERYTLQFGDVLMNEGGDYDKLGRGAVWESQIEGCLHQNHVFAVRLDDFELANWVSAITQTAYAKFYFMNNSKQSTNLASINQGNVKEFPVVLPPPEERVLRQKMLQDEQARIDELVLHAKREIDVLSEFRSSTITDAVLGRLQVPLSTSKDNV